MVARFVSLSALAAALLTPATVAAQNTAAPVAAPAPQPTPSPTPLPTPAVAPVPVVPTLTATPAPTPAATASATATAPRIVRARPSRVDRVVATPNPGVTPTPVPTPSATATRPPPPPIETVILPPQRGPAPIWLWGVGASALLLLLGGGWAALRRRGEPAWEEEYSDEPGPVPELEAAPEPTPGPSPDSRLARLAITLRPTRAGLNLISATVACEVTLTNIGDAPAHEVRAEVRLLSAHGGQDEDLALYYAQPVTRPSTTPFSLEPGEAHQFRAIAALPHDAIRSMDAAGRPMFVPLVALSAYFTSGDTARQVAQAFAVGVEREGSTKLAPFWLDAPAKHYETVAARPHAAMLER